jgi:hypothetical protein
MKKNYIRWPRRTITFDEADQFTTTIDQMFQPAQTVGTSIIN